jgi:hypothetical protein
MVLQYDDPVVRERYAQFNCFKLKTCTSGPPAVCAHNPASLDLAEFEDKCTLYEVNCKKKGCEYEIMSLALLLS